MMVAPQQISIAIDIASVIPRYRPRYTVLTDPPSVEHVVKIADDNPGVFVFVFFTSTAQQGPDFSTLSHLYVVEPLYLGAFESGDHSYIMQMWIERAFGDFMKDAIRI